MLDLNEVEAEDPYAVGSDDDAASEGWEEADADDVEAAAESDDEMDSGDE